MRPVARKFPKMLAVVAIALGAARAIADPLTVTVRTAAGQPLPGAVVMVHALTSDQHPATPIRAVVDQVNLSFVPDLIVVPAGSQVVFPNSDSVSHQIYSFSAAKRFQMPLYRGVAYPPVVFEKSGLVTLGCNIHDSMLAYIMVTDAPFYGRTDAQGVWNAPDVPRGRYRIEVWHPRLREPADVTAELSVAEGSPADVTITLTRALRPVPLNGHPHSWDQY